MTSPLHDRSDRRDDVRLGKPEWRGPEEWRVAQAKLRVLLPISIVLALWYFEWLLRADRVGNPRAGIRVVPVR
jgi:hypothetical protein